MATTLENLICKATVSSGLSDSLQGATRAATSGATFELSLTAGTTANKADRIIQEVSRTLASGSEDLDMYDLAGFTQTTDVLKNTVTFAEIVALLITNSSASIGNLVVGNKNATTAWIGFLTGDTDSFFIKPGGAFFICAPTDPAMAVADTTSHLLTMTASGGSVTYSVYVLGRSA